ncbi:CAMK family protein kinase [Tritrichomonas foetus]|uniref:CAMK family protein kinase n=1 Tax=Tritrichomonas foetus TaxID=1144522 RepID=A0A1J4KQ36_9EUKA|nr:CAMK family protein kinase [Tritrichomonas foetus]|eukprot:OHT11541.1 CAMK family protein kinase [Tritrichomonas foetus]
MDAETSASTLLDSIPRSFGRYDLIKVIEHGSFSTIALVKERTSKVDYACKIVSRKMLKEQNIIHMFEREVRIMQTLHHPNIISLIDSIFAKDYIFLIMEYYHLGDLHEYICEHGPLPEPLIRKIFIQIVKAVNFLHQKKIVHRDLKPENILMHDEGRIVITDFGLCNTVIDNNLMKTFCGSPIYASPEVFMKHPYDGKLNDIWSLGLILFIMAAGRLPWPTDNIVLMKRQICFAEYDVPCDVSPFLRSLICSILKVNPKDRLTINEIIDHPWFTEENDDSSDFSNENDEKKENLDNHKNHNCHKKNNSNDENDEGIKRNNFICKKFDCCEKKLNIKKNERHKLVKSQKTSVVFQQSPILRPKNARIHVTKPTPIQVLIRMIPSNSKKQKYAFLKNHS